MTETEDNPEIVVVEEMPMKHQFGRTVVSSFAAFIASQAAEKAYDAALRRLRSRNS